MYFTVAGTLQQLLFYAYGLSSVVAIVVGTRINRARSKGPWLAFAAGLLLFAVGDIAFEVYAIGGTPAPSPSIADVIYLAAYPVLGFGALMLIRIRARDHDVALALDAAMVATGVGVLAF